MFGWRFVFGACALICLLFVRKHASRVGFRDLRWQSFKEKRCFIGKNTFRMLVVAVLDHYTIDSNGFPENN